MILKENMMFKSNIYDEFSCIANHCSFTCCQEWKISVDDKTLQQWGQHDFDKHVIERDGNHVIHLDSHNKCPYLNEDKLCNLVIKYGDSILSETCATFPRQIHRFDDRVECALVTCCPEVVDLLSRQEDFKVECDKGVCEDYLFLLRDQMMSLVQDDRYSIPKALQMIFYLVLESAEGERVNFKDLSSAIDQMEFSFEDTMNEDNELLLDLIENYRKEGIYKPYLEEIALVAEKVEKEQNIDELSTCWNLFSEDINQHIGLLQKCLAADFFSNVLLPDSDLDDMIVMVQWIGMEYSVIRHALFLKWLSNPQHAISYEEVRDVIVVFSRVTGYGQEDIYEYLENSFESLIWDWGYFALVTGK